MQDIQVNQTWLAYSWAVQSYSCWQWVSDIRYDTIHIFVQIHTSYLSDQTVVWYHFVLKTVVHYNNQPICQSYQDCLSVFRLRWNPHCRWCTHCSSQTGLLVFKLQLVFSSLNCFVWGFLMYHIVDLCLARPITSSHLKRQVMYEIIPISLE